MAKKAKEAKETKRKNGIHFMIPAMTCGPLFVFGILAMIFCGFSFSKKMYEKNEEELREIASSVLLTYDIAFPGDYELVKRKNELAFYKGDAEITGNNEIVDDYFGKTHAEISLFYRDIRMVTTIKDSDGNRIVGYKVNQIVKKDVVDGKQSHFYKKVDINGNYYYVYYQPILTPEGGCVGMIAVAKETKEIDSLVVQAVFPLMIVMGVVMVIMAFISYTYSSNLAGAIESVQKSLARVAGGDLSGELDYKLMKRNDELADIGKSIQRMQKSLHMLVERDALTELFNRRLASRKLEKLIREYAGSSVKYCVALGDIDFFKKVNDIYGHKMGDVVLKEVAKTLRNGMRGKGFASRWGGEEFLLVFERSNIKQAEQILNVLMDDIRALEIPNQNEMTEQELFGQYANNSEEKEENNATVLTGSNDRYAPVDRSVAQKIIKITMTFGLAAGLADRDKDTLVRIADDNLYAGKEGGRNRVVTELIEEEEVEEAKEIEETEEVVIANKDVDLATIPDDVSELVLDEIPEEMIALMNEEVVIKDSEENDN